MILSAEFLHYLYVPYAKMADILIFFCLGSLKMCVVFKLFSQTQSRLFFG